MNSTTNPTVLAFDLLCANALNESLSIYEMDTSGVPDANNPNQSIITIREATPGRTFSTARNILRCTPYER